MSYQTTATFEGQPSAGSNRQGTVVWAVMGAVMALCGSALVVAYAPAPLQQLWATSGTSTVSTPVLAQVAHKSSSAYFPSRGATALNQLNDATVLQTGSIAQPATLATSPWESATGFAGITAVALAAVLYFRSLLCNNGPSMLEQFMMAAASGSPEADDEKWVSNEVQAVPVSQEVVAVPAGPTAEENKAAWLLRFAIGRVGFLCQIWLSVISAAIIFFTAQFIYSGASAFIGLGFTVISNIASWFSVLWTLRCRHIGKVLNREIVTKDGSLPTKIDVVRLLWSGLIINLNGLVAAIVGIEANAGLLLAQSLTAGPTVMVPGYGKGVAAFDVFAQLAQAQALLSLIIGLCLGLVALRVVTQPFAKKTVSKSPA